MINLSDKSEIMTNDSEGKESVSRPVPEYSLDLAPLGFMSQAPPALLTSSGSAQLRLPLSKQPPAHCIPQERSLATPPGFLSWVPEHILGQSPTCVFLIPVTSLNTCRIMDSTPSKCSPA